MADYKTIHGEKIKSYTTDPDNILEGQHGVNWIESDCPGAGNLILYNKKKREADEANVRIPFSKTFWSN